MIYHHLHHALRIMRQQADFREWGPMIDALPAEAQDEVRTFLRDRARIALYRQQGTRSLATLKSSGSRR